MQSTLVPMHQCSTQALLQVYPHILLKNTHESSMMGKVVAMLWDEEKILHLSSSEAAAACSDDVGSIPWEYWRKSFKWTVSRRFATSKIPTPSIYAS